MCVIMIELLKFIYYNCVGCNFIVFLMNKFAIFMLMITDIYSSSTNSVHLCISNYGTFCLEYVGENQTVDEAEMENAKRILRGEINRILPELEQEQTSFYAKINKCFNNKVNCFNMLTSKDPVNVTKPEQYNKRREECIARCKDVIKEIEDVHEQIKIWKAKIDEIARDEKRLFVLENKLNFNEVFIVNKKTVQYYMLLDGAFDADDVSTDEHKVQIAEYLETNRSVGHYQGEISEKQKALIEKFIVLCKKEGWFIYQTNFLERLKKELQGRIESVEMGLIW